MAYYDKKSIIVIESALCMSRTKYTCTLQCKLHSRSLLIGIVSLFIDGLQNKKYLRTYENIFTTELIRNGLMKWKI